MGDANMKIAEYDFNSVKWIFFGEEAVMLNFIIGLVLGFVAGVVMMCILFVAREKKAR
jgi:hypothetical protein